MNFMVKHLGEGNIEFHLILSFLFHFCERLLAGAIVAAPKSLFFLFFEILTI